MAFIFCSPIRTRIMKSNSPVGCWVWGRAPTPPYNSPSGRIGNESVRGRQKRKAIQQDGFSFLFTDKDSKIKMQHSEIYEGLFQPNFYFLRSRTKWFCPSSLRSTMQPIASSSAATLGSIVAIINMGNSNPSLYFSSVSLKQKQ